MSFAEQAEDSPPPRQNVDVTYAGGVNRYAVVVETRPRQGIADPEGATIERSLPALGFEGVTDVRVGKAFRFTVEMSDAWATRTFVEEMCQRFLANPVIEDFEIVSLQAEEERAS